jgi:hypothetical protein
MLMQIPILMIGLANLLQYVHTCNQRRFVNTPKWAIITCNVILISYQRCL